MAEQRINVDRLAETIMQDLEIYAQNTVRDVEYAVNKVARMTVAELYEDHTPWRTGDYARSWAARRHPYAGKDYHSKVVYSRAPHHGKTHLLENGHEAPDGSFVAARPHLKQVEAKAQRWMYDILTARLSKRRNT